jgi:LCP family protein required for cell wall assembly
MDIRRKLNSYPKTWISIAIFWVLLFVILIIVTIGYFQVGKSLAYGLIDLPRIGNFIARLSPRKAEVDQTVLPTTTPLEQPQISEPVIMPEGVLETWDGTGRVTILIMGMDYRDWLGGPGPSRTDTMMLLTMDPLSNTAGILSLPRDLWVSIPGLDNNRINTAYFFGEAYDLPGGGPAMAVRTVEQFLGVRINYYAVVDFGAFVRFIEELGGVKIDVPAKISIDPIVGKPVQLQPGVQTLTGELALAYARARNTAGGDLDRALRQQQVIMGIRDRLLKPASLLALIDSAPALYTEIINGIKTNLSLDEVIKLAWLAQKIPSENIKQRSVSHTDVIMARTPAGASVLLPLTENIRQLRDEVFLTSPGILGPLSPGTQQEKMVAEGAKLSLINGSSVPGLAEITQSLLTEHGGKVVTSTDGSYQNNTYVIDFTGNPHTVRYLLEFFGLPAGSNELQYDPSSSVDVQIILGRDWSSKVNGQ